MRSAILALTLSLTAVGLGGCDDTKPADPKDSGQQDLNVVDLATSDTTPNDAGPGVDLARTEGSVPQADLPKPGSDAKVDSVVVKPDSNVVKPDSNVVKPDVLQPDGSGSSKAKFVTVANGTFQMGSTVGALCSVLEQQHEVTLTHSFEIQTTEVTQAQFQALMSYNPSKFTSCGTDCPVEKVNWHEAAAYCNALSASLGYTKCYACTGSGATVTCNSAAGYGSTLLYKCPGYRLPSEAEWEYAARAGTTTPFYNGGISTCTGTDANLDAIGWYKANANNATHPVAKKAPNAWGLYDMSGNVAEWVHDSFSSGTNYPSTPQTDPVFGSTSDSWRSPRGGAWWRDPQYCRSADRGYGCTRGSQSDAIGFRCARSLNP